MRESEGMWRFLGGMLLCSLILWGCAGSSGTVTENLPASASGISGQVKDTAGKPVSGAWVYVYRNTSSGLRGPADFAAQTDVRGRYFLDLVAGRYYLIARWREAGGEAGPPRTGDAWALYPHNPLEVKDGRISEANFLLQGVQPGQPALLRSGSLSQGRTGFTGRLIDRSGQPVPGAFALAYTDADFRRMPDFTSAVVGAEGRFELYLPAGGRYCLAGRTRTRGQPIAGEPYGLLGEGDAGCRVARSNQMTDVGDIVLAPYQR